LRRDFAIPPQLEPAVIAGFGYPAKKGNRTKKGAKIPLEEMVSLEKYSNKFDTTPLR
jgi:hypothetical protein